MRRLTRLIPFAFALLATGCIADGGEPLPEAAEPPPEEAEIGRSDGEVDGEVDAEPDAGPDPEPEPEPDGCLPYDDRCPQGEYCQYVDGVGLTCIPEGDVAPDGQHHSAPACPAGVCRRGGICMTDPNADSGGDLRCFDPCGPDASPPCLNGRHTCREALSADGTPLGFGLCDY